MSNDQSSLTKEFSLSAQELLDKAIENGEGVVASNGALSVETGKRTAEVLMTDLLLKNLARKI